MARTTLMLVLQATVVGWWCCHGLASAQPAAVVPSAARAGWQRIQARYAQCSFDLYSQLTPTLPNPDGTVQKEVAETHACRVRDGAMLWRIAPVAAAPRSASQTLVLRNADGEFTVRRGAGDHWELTGAKALDELGEAGMATANFFSATHVWLFDLLDVSNSKDWKCEEWSNRPDGLVSASFLFIGEAEQQTARGMRTPAIRSLDGQVWPYAKRLRATLDPAANYRLVDAVLMRPIDAQSFSELKYSYDYDSKSPYQDLPTEVTLHEMSGAEQPVEVRRVTYATKNVSLTAPPRAEFDLGYYGLAKPGVPPIPPVRWRRLPRLSRP